MGAAPALGAAKFTLETWFKRTGAGVGTSTGSGGIASAIPLVTKGRAEAEGSNVDMNYFLGIDATTGKLVADFEEVGRPGPARTIPSSGTTVVTSNVWHHAAATYDGTTWKLYLDGVLDGKLAAVAAAAASDSIQHAALGTAMNSTGVAAGFFQGDLDEARIWNYRAHRRRRSARRATARSPPRPACVGRFGMNEGAGTTVANSAGSPNGTAVGGPAWIAGYGFPAGRDRARRADEPRRDAPTTATRHADLDANGEPDLAGYDLYRSTTTPVTRPARQ